LSDADAYLRELRRELPLGCRRRFVAELREHFASATAAEAERGVSVLDAERSTIERLGPPRALADQLLADLRSGALGRRGRLAVALTTARAAALAVLVTIAIVFGAVFAATRSSPAPPPPQRAAGPQLVIEPQTGYARPVLLTLQAAVQRHYTAQAVTPIAIRLTHVP
jgi:hypothetical protein